MDNETQKKINFLYGVIITMGTIIIGLTSYIFYASNLDIFNKPKMCEYNGWGYSNGEKYKSEDGCNTCFCSNGETICTEMACTNEKPLEQP